MEDIEAIVRESGHSTARMAGAFAKECEAKRLVLTHISSRYPANSKRFDSPEMREMRELAVVRSALWSETQQSFGSEGVVVANDFTSLSL